MKWLHRLLRWVLPSIEVDGRELDQDLRALLFLANRNRPLEDYPPVEARSQATKRRKLLPKPPVELFAVEDLNAAGLPMRRYRPSSTPSGRGLLYFHGGGFVIGDLESHDHLCRTLAKEGDCEVIAVDYRLAPEHPFPAAVEDALAAWTWFREQPFERRLVGGDSAGANLAAVICQQAEHPPDGQLLIYPATDRHGDWPSRSTYAEGFLLTSAMAVWFKEHYLPEGIDRQDERVSPLFREDLSGQPPAYVLLAGFDILLDEGRAYIDKLKAAGVPVTVQFEGSLIHGFSSLAGVSPASLRAVQQAGRCLRAL